MRLFALLATLLFAFDAHAFRLGTAPEEAPTSEVAAPAAEAPKDLNSGSVAVTALPETSTLCTEFRRTYAEHELPEPEDYAQCDSRTKKTIKLAQTWQDTALGAGSRPLGCDRFQGLLFDVKALREEATAECQAKGPSLAFRIKIDRAQQICLNNQRKSGSPSLDKYSPQDARELLLKEATALKRMNQKASPSCKTMRNAALDNLDHTLFLYNSAAAVFQRVGDVLRAESTSCVAEKAKAQAEVPHPTAKSPRPLTDEEFNKRFNGVAPGAAPAN